MKKQKQKQVEMSSEALDKEVDGTFKEHLVATMKAKKLKKAQRNSNILKYFRLVHVASLVLGSVLLLQQDFIYARVLGVIIALTTGERLWMLVFRGK